MRLIKAGAADQSCMIRFLDSTDGSPETGVTSATAGLTVTYRITGAAAVALTSATTPAINDLAALTTAHTDAGLKHIADGWYRFDLPDAAVASGVTCMVTATATGMVGFGVVLQLVPFDPQDAVRLGLTSLPNATVSGVGGLLTAPTTANVGTVDLVRILGTALSETVGGYLAAGLKKLLDVASPVFTLASVNQSGDSFARLGAPAGASVSADIAAIEAQTDDIGVAGAGLTALGDVRLANLDAAVSTRSTYAGGAVASVTGSVGSIASGGITATSIATGAIDADALAADAIDLIWDEAQSGHTGAGTFGKYLDAQVSGATAPAASVVADAVWDEARGTHTGAGTFGLYLDAQVSTVGGGSLTAASIADAVWDEAVSGHTTAGTFGEYIPDIAEDVWGYSTRTLTQSAASVASTVNGSDISVYRGDTWGIDLTGVGSLASRTKLWFTVKADIGDTDSEAICQIEETGGLLYMMGATTTTTNGTIAVTNETTGALTITVKPTETDDVPVGTYHYDLQWYNGTTVTTKSQGIFVVQGDVTRTTG